MINLLDKCRLSHHIICGGKLNRKQEITDEWDKVDRIIADEAKAALNNLKAMVKKRETK